MRKTIFKSAKSLCGAVALIALLISVLSFTPPKNQPNFSFAYLSDLHIAEGAGSIEDLNACVADINSNKALKLQATLQTLAQTRSLNLPNPSWTR